MRTWTFRLTFLICSASPARASDVTVAHATLGLVALIPAEHILILAFKSVDSVLTWPPLGISGPVILANRHL